ncbi:hypothetical protein WDU94_012239, partial [Cyamophila willieti]
MSTTIQPNFLPAFATRTQTAAVTSLMEPSLELGNDTRLENDSDPSSHLLDVSMDSQMVSDPPPMSQLQVSELTSEISPPPHPSKLSVLTNSETVQNKASESDDNIQEKENNSAPSHVSEEIDKNSLSMETNEPSQGIKRQYIDSPSSKDPKDKKACVANEESELYLILKPILENFDPK